MRGEIDAAAARALPRLIDRADLRGDLHMHTTETDGKDDVADDGGGGAGRRGSSTSPSPITASRWRWPTGSTSGGRSRTPPASARSTREGLGVRLLAGIECDIKPDGSLDLADDCLAALDLVVVSVHSAFNQDRQQMTDRLLRAIENPHVDILGHPDRPADPAAASRTRSTSRRSSTPRRGTASRSRSTVRSTGST